MVHMRKPIGGTNLAGSRDEDDVVVSPQTPRFTRRRVLQVAAVGAAAVVSASVAASSLYRGLAPMATPVHHMSTGVQGGPPAGGYPIGQYQIANYGMRVEPDPVSQVILNIPPIWNL